MAGVVLETLSSRKLYVLAGCVLLMQVTCFLLGALIAPNPSGVQQITGTFCTDVGKHNGKNAWFYSRGNGKCKKVDSLDDEATHKDQIEANQIVFTFQIPLPKDNMELDMSRWFQHLISVLHIDVVFNPDVPYDEDKDHKITLDARLGYRNKGDPASNWTEIARSSEERQLKCTVIKKENDYPLDCELLAFFELGSCHHDFYLVNIRLPVHAISGMNTDIGSIRDMNLAIIWQNGGFTKVWFSLKTFFCPFLLAGIVWYWRRITQMQRPSVLLEKTLFALSLALTFLNVPIEWFTLAFDIPFMLLLTDIRQGIFFAFLLCFWLIFTGEHMMDQIERNQLVLYWKHLSAVIFGCICLFVFEMCERGVQLKNPFYSIWVTETGKNMALTFIILAGIAACCYFIFLCYMVFRVFRNISAKKSALPSMSKAKKKYYMGLIFRFKFLMMYTLLCAALSVIFFILSQVSEGHWKWGEESKLEYSSGFFTGVYGMWNLYVFSLLCLYAPSHKTKPLTENDDSNDDVVEFSNLESEASRLTRDEPTASEAETSVSVLTAFAKKAALD